MRCVARCCRLSDCRRPCRPTLTPLTLPPLSSCFFALPTPQADYAPLEKVCSSRWEWYKTTVQVAEGVVKALSAKKKKKTKASAETGS